MLRGVEKGFFPESKAFLGQLANADFANQPCIVKQFVEEKQRWAVQLVHPRFKGRQILVSEDKLIFDGYAAPPDYKAVLPEHLYEASAGLCGLALYCRRELREGELVLEESPLMVASNRGSPVEARWSLHTRLSSEQGANSSVLRAFQELSDGGLVERMTPEATTMFRAIVEKSSKPPEVKRMMLESEEAQDLRDSQIEAVARVLARWQANGHSFRSRGEETQDGAPSALYRCFSRMLHSCEPNCTRSICPDTGLMSVLAARDIEHDELLTIDYEAKDPGFLQRPLSERRAKLRERGFTCACARCEREAEAG